jgi:hypothetical protein
MTKAVQLFLLTLNGCILSIVVFWIVTPCSLVGYSGLKKKTARSSEKNW